MFVPLPCLLALLLPVLIGLPATATPWRPGVRIVIAASSAGAAVVALALAWLVYGPGTPAFMPIARIAHL